MTVLAFGQLADETLLTSQRIFPRRLEETGYEFRHPTPAEALAHVLGTPPERR